MGVPWRWARMAPQPQLQRLQMASERPQQGALEEGVARLPAPILGAQDGHGLLGWDAASAAPVVARHKAGKGLARHQADVEGRARRGARGPAGAVEDGQVLGALQDDITGQGIRHDVLRVLAQATNRPALASSIIRIV